VSGLIGKLPPGKQVDLIRAMGPLSLSCQAAAFTSLLVLRQHRPGDMDGSCYRHGVLSGRSTGTTSVFEELVAGSRVEFIEKTRSPPERCWIAEIDGENAGSCVSGEEIRRRLAKLRLLLVNRRPAAGHRKTVGGGMRPFWRRDRVQKIMLWTQSELTSARRIYQNAASS